jgi:hypothetical protein
MLAFVFLPAISGDFRCYVLVSLTNTVLLLGAPMLPTWWVKISTYLHLELFLLITFMLLIINRIYYYYYYYNSDLYYYYYYYYYILIITNLIELLLLLLYLVWLS